MVTVTPKSNEELKRIKNDEGKKIKMVQKEEQDRIKKAYQEQVGRSTQDDMTEILRSAYRSMDDSYAEHLWSKGTLRFKASTGMKKKF